MKVKLALTLLIASAVPIILVGYVSYYWMYVVQIERNNEDIQEQVQNINRELENRFDELGRSSQLLSSEGGIGRELIRYLQSDDAFDRSLMYQSLSESTANVGFANPGINLLLYYVPTYKEPLLFPNVRISDASFKVNPKTLFVKNLLSYYGPHESLNGQPNTMVVSLLREMETLESTPVYIYVERDISDIFESLSEEWLIINESNEVVYSRLGEWTNGETFVENIDGYQLFKAVGDQPWKLYRVITDKDYFHVINQWKRQVMLIAFISFIVVVILAWSIWKIIYKPIYLINRTIQKYSYDITSPSIAKTGTQEFDNVLSSFKEMKDRIAELIADVEDKEKRRGQLEVEKLLVQINPHFIHNTLNTIQWIARMNHQQEIARLVSIFTRILHYNLGKKNIIVTIQEEINAIKDYIELQSIRYDHQFNIQVHVDSDTVNIPIPRFILQPLVENAMYHGGQDDNVEINVDITKLEHGVSLSVRDNGEGISKERLAELTGEIDDLRKSGLGIGLSYVKKMISIYYDSSAKFQIESKPGEGTVINIILPDQLREGMNEI